MVALESFMTLGRKSIRFDHETGDRIKGTHYKDREELSVLSSDRHPRTSEKDQPGVSNLSQNEMNYGVAIS